MPPLLEMRGIRKEYPGVLALNNVDLMLNSGEVHCLVGENGAGKSTLMNVLSGAVSKDSGEIIIEGRYADIRNPADAQRLGIGVIHQDFRLVPSLSVGENILLGREPVRSPLPFIDYATMHEVARGVLQQLGETIPTNAFAGSLNPARQQIVEIAKAVSRKARILAMDEPSAALTARELQNLFALVRRLKSEGVGIIYISHRLEEVFEIGDQVTVLRDGQLVGTAAVREMDRRRLIQWMVGREMEDEYPKASFQKGKEVFRIENLSSDRIRNVSLSIGQGEILGLAGLAGAGRSELARAIFGADSRVAGRMYLESKEIDPPSPAEAIELGIGLLTEDRNRYGLIPSMSVKENLTLANLRELLRGVILDLRREESVARRYVDELRIKTPSIHASVETLSGGNRQKVVLARWLYTKSKLLIFDEPTAGIDVGARHEIYVLMNKLVEEGIGLMMISSDLPELLGMCDRIAVMHDGTITGVLTRAEATQEGIMMLATNTRPHIPDA